MSITHTVRTVMSTILPCPSRTFPTLPRGSHTFHANETELEPVHAHHALPRLGRVQQVRGVARGAPRCAVLAFGIAPPLAPGARTGRPTGAVSLDVLTQVVASHKPLVAHRAGEPFLAGVRA